jgi:hypothetical protein
MRNTVDQFYGARACEAVDAIIRTDRYKDAQDRYIDRRKMLFVSLSPEQRALSAEIDEAYGELTDLHWDAVFKAAFLEGYAAGTIRAGDYKYD